jgi:hypothetical protein
MRNRPFRKYCQANLDKTPVKMPGGTNSTLMLGGASGMPTFGAKSLLSPPSEGIADYLPQCPVSKVIPMFGAPAGRAVHGP